MSYNIIVEPYDFTPAYNPMRFQVDSTNKNNPGFKYVFDVYESGTTTKIGEYKVYPRYGDGYGEIDLSKLLQNKVSYDFHPTLTSSINPADSYYKYDIEFGEEYIVTNVYTASLANDSGYTQITFTAACTYLVGDQVVINQSDGGVANPLLQGLFTVIGTSGTTKITVNVLWANIVNATIDGYVKYADNRKTIYRDIIASPNKYVFNGAQSFKEFRNYVEANYIPNSGGDFWLTSMPDSGFYATESQDIWLNFANNFYTTGFIYFTNSLGDVYSKPITNNNMVTQVGVGPNNYGALTLIAGSGTGLLDPGVTSYIIQYRDSTGDKWSIEYEINLDQRCKINNYEIVFMDRMGSMNSFAFQLRAYEKGTTKRDTYNQYIVGDISSDIWRYETYDRGNTVINPTVEKTIDLATNWMTEEMSVYFEELVTSPVTYLKDTDGLYYACLIQDTSFEINRQKNKNLFKKNLSIKYANDNIING